MNNPNFIPNAITYLHRYVHSSNEQVKSYPYQEVLSIYMSLSHDCTENFIGCFLIRILRGTSIIYASPARSNVVLTQLQSCRDSSASYIAYMKQHHCNYSVTYA